MKTARNSPAVDRQLAHAVQPHPGKRQQHERQHLEAVSMPICVGEACRPSRPSGQGQHGGSGHRTSWSGPRSTSAGKMGWRSVVRRQAPSLEDCGHGAGLVDSAFPQDTAGTARGWGIPSQRPAQVRHPLRRDGMRLLPDGARLWPPMRIKAHARTIARPHGDGPAASSSARKKRGPAGSLGSTGPSAPERKGLASARDAQLR